MSYLTASQSSGRLKVSRETDFWLNSNFSNRDVAWLKNNFSVKGIYNLKTRGIDTFGLREVKNLVDMDICRIRGYISKTNLPISNIRRLMEVNVSCHSMLKWNHLYSFYYKRSLDEVLLESTFFHNISSEHFKDWVNLAICHPFVVEDQVEWGFVGGITGPLAMAGVDVFEAKLLYPQIVESTSKMRKLSKKLQIMAALRN